MNSEKMFPWGFWRYNLRFSFSQVTKGVAELAETVGNAAANVSEQLAAVAQKVDQMEEKKFPRRRNGLD